MLVGYNSSHNDLTFQIRNSLLHLVELSLFLHGEKIIRMKENSLSFVNPEMSRVKQKPQLVLKEEVLFPGGSGSGINKDIPILGGRLFSVRYK